jgi:hypothetical protein
VAGGGAGGLVALGVAPQPEGEGEPGKYDIPTGWWINNYRFFGHMDENMVQTLHFDRECCHVQVLFLGRFINVLMHCYEHIELCSATSNEVFSQRKRL